MWIWLVRGIIDVAQRGEFINLKRELKPILNFIAQQGLSPGSVVEFSNDGLRFGGNSFPKKGEVATPTQEAIFRQLMREVVLLQDRLPTHVQLGMKGGNTYLTDKKGRVITIKEKKKL